MYYFDNAATTWPKPNSVTASAANCILKYGANPNRGGYAMAREAGHIVLNCRRRLCSFFNTSDPFEYIFTYNTTHALNFAIKGILKPGMHAVTTSLEHNSVLRPLYSLKSNSVDVDIVNADSRGMINPAHIALALKHNTQLLIISHASNVVGTIQPIEEIIHIAHKNGTLVLIDAAQSAGAVNIDIEKLGADMIAMPGHKGLYGLQGTGVLYIKNGTPITSIIEGGTGSESKILAQPDIMPDKFEAGTQNAPGIAALSEALDFLSAKTVKHVSEHENNLAEYFYNELKKNDNIYLYGPEDMSKRCGIVTLNIGNTDPGTIESILDKKYNIAVRSGFHCAPLAHKSIGTYETGAVRFSFGFYNDEKQIEYAIRAVRELASEA